MLNRGEAAFLDLTNEFLKLVKVEHIMPTVVMRIEYPWVEALHNSKNDVNVLILVESPSIWLNIKMTLPLNVSRKMLSSQTLISRMP